MGFWVPASPQSSPRRPMVAARSGGNRTAASDARPATRHLELGALGGGRRVCHGAPATSAPIDHASRASWGGRRGSPGRGRRRAGPGAGGQRLGSRGAEAPRRPGPPPGGGGPRRLRRAYRDLSGASPQMPPSGPPAVLESRTAAAKRYSRATPDAAFWRRVSESGADEVLGDSVGGIVQRMSASSTIHRRYRWSRSVWDAGCRAASTPCRLPRGSGGSPPRPTLVDREGWDPDGVAPVTRRSGRSMIMTRRQAAHDRLRNSATAGPASPPNATRPATTSTGRSGLAATATRVLCARWPTARCTSPAMLRDRAYFDPHRVGSAAT